MSSPSVVAWLLIAALSIAAPLPAAPPDPPGDGGTVEVFRADGSLQCEPDSGTPPEVMAAQLTAAGIAVQGSRIGHDGLMRTAVCGAPTGRLNIFRIGGEDLATARTLGFEPVSR